MRIGGLSSVYKARTQVKKEEDHSKLETVEEEKQYAQASQEQIVEIFASLAKEFKSKKKMTIASFLADPVLEMKEKVVELYVGSKILDKEWQLHEPTIRKAFKDKGINPQFEVSVNAEKFNEYKIFTPKEEFEALAKTNPILKSFQDRFGLDFDA